MALADADSVSLDRLMGGIPGASTRAGSLAILSGSILGHWNDFVGRCACLPWLTPAPLTHSLPQAAGAIVTNAAALAVGAGGTQTNAVTGTYP